MSRTPQAHIPAGQERRWLEENKDAVASIDAFVERYGLLASKLRSRPDRDGSGA